MRGVTVKQDRWMWAGVGIFIVGRLIDLVFHATHEEFETAVDQIQAHAVVWLGVVVLLAAAMRALSRRKPEGGYFLLLFGTVLYAGVAAWHFWEHSQLRDPDLPHALLVAATLVMLASVVWIAVDVASGRRRGMRPIEPVRRP